MKKIYSILFLLIAVSLGFSSCSDDDVVKTQLEAPAISSDITKATSLSFNWQPVAGATQYAYELYDANDNRVLGDMTSGTTLIATGLEPTTTYTLKVWAYAALTGDKSTSPIATLTATTTAQTPLANPVPSASSANGGVTITWPEVENATGYSYHYQDADGKEVSGQTETNSVLLTGLAIGEYTIYITATSSDPEYADSEPIELKFERTKAEVWRHTGTYTSAALGKSFTATLVHYDDGSYTLENPLGEEGYSISFTIPEGSTEITPSTTADDYGYYSIYLSSKYYVSIYPSGGYSQFTGDEYAGEVWFCSYLYYGCRFHGCGRRRHKNCCL